MNKVINTAFMRLAKRAESKDRAKLVETFVDAEPLLTLLSTTDHQVIYGRRGTGKTHALLYLHETQQGQGDISVYLDMRTVGSTGGIYADSSVPVAERATRLLCDTLAAIHDSILEYALESERLDLSGLSPILDQLAAGIAEVVVVGQIETEGETESGLQQAKKSERALALGPKEPGLRLESKTEKTLSEKKTERVKETGTLRNRLHFGRIGQCFQQLTKFVSPRKIWVLLDEWSSVPLDLQPYLADLVRRALLPQAGLVGKIGAIEQRTQFQLSGDRGDYVGLELGADIAANLNLDDFMVFENDSGRATRFFQELLFKHFKSIEDAPMTWSPATSAELIQLSFTQWNAFEEYTRAAEGVPRDAINILSTAAQKAFADASGQRGCGRRERLGSFPFALDN